MGKKRKKNKARESWEGFHGYGYGPGPWAGHGRGYGPSPWYPDEGAPEGDPRAGYGGPEGDAYQDQRGRHRYRGDEEGWLHRLTHMLDAPHRDKFLLGLMVGAGAAWILSDEEMRRKIMKAGLDLYAGMAGGVEEIKEQMADIKAEMEAERHGDR
ncbi:YtxH domain-containing protein [Ectothiorhodospira lacustris]|uniref:YtxH domain-containing protein n=1 Tax=Ectothiorhodospira lacustris TaxID=2899127 RepID=UPI001EE91F53|nr:YtxH domain-containing protein [Ectothiorhodospira lacustris]MCG5511480.1 YtxH domain-containing protein [Ectothiorhodospira lacustris]MCG5523270.1 YtxH domain-containing protein [Ectothiorhodospira lacustris]